MPVFPRSFSPLRRLAADRRGVTAVTTGLALTMLAGFAGLAVDASSWQAARRNMQGAADQAAYSAAVAATAGANGTTNAKGVTAQMGYVDGQGGVTVTVNNPPTSGSYTTNNKAWEVIVTQPQHLWFARALISAAPSASARAVAIPGITGQFCLLALDTSSSGSIALQGSPQINTPSCNIMANSSSASAITLGGSAKITASTVAMGGNPGYSATGSSQISATTIDSSAAAIKDPYAGVSLPASSTWGGCSPAPTVGNHQTVTISAGCYTGNLLVPSGSTLVMGAGTYYIDRGSISTNGGTITSNGAGVTIVLTSTTGGSWSTIGLSGNSTINLTAQNSGTFAGLVVYADRRMPNSTSMSLGGGSTQTFTGDLYFPTTEVTFGGNASSSTCTRLVALRINLGGNSTFQSSCSGIGTASITGDTTFVAE